MKQKDPSTKQLQVGIGRLREACQPTLPTNGKGEGREEEKEKEQAKEVSRV